MELALNFAKLSTKTCNKSNSIEPISYHSKCKPFCGRPDLDSHGCIVSQDPPKQPFRAVSPFYPSSRPFLLLQGHRMKQIILDDEYHHQLISLSFATRSFYERNHMERWIVFTEYHSSHTLAALMGFHIHKKYQSAKSINVQLIHILVTIKESQLSVPPALLTVARELLAPHPPPNLTNVPLYSPCPCF